MLSTAARSAASVSQDMGQAVTVDLITAVVGEQLHVVPQLEVAGGHE